MASSRTRQERRGSRAAIWRGSAAPLPADAAAVQHGVRPRGLGGARLVSAAIVISMMLALAVFFLTDPFYVHGAAVGGNDYLTVSEVYTIADVEGWHLFWIDPDVIRERLIRFPTIAQATVQIGWPPSMVQIAIEEREPALVWEQAGVTVWVDLQGRIMGQRRDIQGLTRVIADSIEADALGANMRLPVEVVTGALQLSRLAPDIPNLRYHPNKGLGYNDPRGWEAWFGSGTNMSEKMLIYTGIVAQVQPRIGAALVEINVGNPDAPVYCCVVQ